MRKKNSISRCTIGVLTLTQSLFAFAGSKPSSTVSLPTRPQIIEQLQFQFHLPKDLAAVTAGYLDFHSWIGAATRNVISIQDGRLQTLVPKGLFHLPISMRSVLFRCQESQMQLPFPEEAPIIT